MVATSGNMSPGSRAFRREAKQRVKRLGGSAICSGPAQARHGEQFPRPCRGLAHSRMVSHSLRCSIITGVRRVGSLAPWCSREGSGPGLPGAGLIRKPAPLLQAHDSIVSAESQSARVVLYAAI